MQKQKSTHSLSIFSNAAADPAFALVVPNLPNGQSSFQRSHSTEAGSHLRNENNIPFSILQPRLIDLLEINLLLLQFLLPGGDIIERSDSTTVLTHSREMGRGQEFFQDIFTCIKVRGCTGATKRIATYLLRPWLL